MSEFERESVPHEKTLDSSVALMTEGYEFIFNRRKAFGSDIFETRLLGKPAICMGGKEAARLFYDTDRFHRQGAIPKRIQKSLFGQGGVQTLDGQEHAHRKRLFMDLMTPERLKQLEGIAEKAWLDAAERWIGREAVVLFDEARDVLCRSAYEWAGVPLDEDEVQERGQEYIEMVDAFGAVGLRHRRGRQARAKAERRIAELIGEIRDGLRQVPEETAAHAMAWHRGLDGQLLDAKVAAVELINILRPIVAISWYVMFSAMALHDYPACADKLRMKVDGDGHGDYTQWFVQEVRRFYPFTPMLGAVVSRDFVWRGCEFKEGTMVLLDLYGTNRDPALWEDPETFRPERFRSWEGGPFDLIPQGGGDHYTGHRCAGEWLTIDMMRVSLDFLVNRVTYTVPEQDLNLKLSRMPAMPESRFVISEVKWAGG
ncbi:cytochrome P450 [Paenibacillus sanfengchensis]|uniref:cytochrome P450 n=1 Tax=Paenibacillus sanfengchensis TaxID=3119819 RepID=UPI002FE3A7B4